MAGLKYLMARTPLFMSRRVRQERPRFRTGLSTRTDGKYLGKVGKVLREGGAADVAYKITIV